MEKKPYTKPKTQTAGRVVSPRKRLSESEGDGTCVVCALSIEIFAVGQCDHFICFKCSTKIRLLCEEDLCPVCRKELPKVIFSKKRDAFATLNSLKLIKDSDFDVGVYFADLSIIKDYRRILEHKCPICSDRPSDKTFDQTKAHLRKEHTMFYCEICLEHNRTFTSECKVYNRKELARHKRIGDPDDKSHRGHPLCEYCDIRFLDEDKLFHHLRTTHYFCHLCDHGETNEFYGTYPDLRIHFKEEHYLCEEGGCASEEFTSVFGTDIDFKAHIASVHKENRSKQQQKKDRQLRLEFQYGRREPISVREKGGSSKGKDRQGYQHSRQNDKVDYSNAFERESDLARAIALSKEEKEKTDKKEARKDKNKSSQLPSSQEALTPLLVKNNPAAFTEDDFPNLKMSVKKSLDDLRKDAEQTTKSDSGNNLLLWSKDSSKFQNNEDFPSLLLQKPSTSASWTSSQKTAKQLKKPSEMSKKASSVASSSGIKSTNKSKKLPKGFKGYEKDFPRLDSWNEVPVGRGSSKHLEGFQSYADGPTTNVSVVSAEFKELNTGKNKPEKKSSSFKVFKQDFPTLLSGNPKISAPPGFANVTPNPFLLGKASVQPNNEKIDSKSNLLTAIKPPPGFASNSITEQKQENANILALKGSDNFPTFVYPAQIIPDFVGGDLSISNSTHSGSGQELNHSSTKSKNSSKKKSKGFKSKSRDSNFPSLPASAESHDHWRVPSELQPSHGSARSAKHETPDCRSMIEMIRFGAKLSRIKTREIS